MFNSAFSDIKNIKESELNTSIKQIIIQLNKHIGKDRFNHYRPANELVKLGVSKDYFSPETLDNFDKIFKEINTLFE